MKSLPIRRGGVGGALHASKKQFPGSGGQRASEKKENAAHQLFADPPRSIYRA
jgi:hypothetical protein